MGVPLPRMISSLMFSIELCVNGKWLKLLLFSKAVEGEKSLTKVFPIRG
jgi:hypothetical protein